MARTANFWNVSHDDLVAAVRDLVRRGRISAADVRAAAARAGRIAALEAELARLRGGRDRADRARRTRPVATSAPMAKPKRHITNTPKRKAAMRRQGRYLGALARLAGRDRARVVGVARKQGVVPALKVAAKLLAK